MFFSIPTLAELYLLGEVMRGFYQLEPQLAPLLKSPPDLLNVVTLQLTFVPGFNQRNIWSGDPLVQAPACMSH